MFLKKKKKTCSNSLLMSLKLLNNVSKNLIGFSNRYRIFPVNNTRLIFSKLIDLPFQKSKR